MTITEILTSPLAVGDEIVMIYRDYISDVGFDRCVIGKVVLFTPDYLTLKEKFSDDDGDYVQDINYKLMNIIKIKILVSDCDLGL